MTGNKKYLSLILTALLLSAGSTKAQENKPELSEADIMDSEVAAIYGKACEDFKTDEPKSSTRVRVIDKASFAATEGLPILDKLKHKVDEQDFNNLVYDLVDNYVEDLAVRTLRQNDKDICVEVTGYLNKREIMDSVKALEDQVQAEAKEKTAEAQPTETEIKPSTPQTAKADNLKTVQSEAPAVITDGRVHLFIEPTAFYNQTNSNKFAEIIAKQFENSENIELVSNKDSAYLIIKSNVLKAKVDPINSNTNRLQMVVSVELENAEGEIISTEHQNRFVLFSSDEDEQEVALRLMKKLFENACERIIQKIKKPEIEAYRPQKTEFITPAGKNAKE